VVGVLNRRAYDSVVVLSRMKLAIIRNSMTGGRAALMVTGGALGLLVAATTIWLSLVDPSGPGVVPDLLASAYLLWLLGWVAGPMWGASAVLRVDHFALLPVPRRQLAVGLLGAAFVGVTTAVTAVAFLSLVVYGIRRGVLPALVGCRRPRCNWYWSCCCPARRTASSA
jgi:hypothetical protein